MVFTVYATLFGYTITNHNVNADSSLNAIELVRLHMSKQAILWEEAEFISIEGEVEPYGRHHQMDNSRASR